ncbi:uncharacterized protein STEHIDRAFT_120419 [Stereum hirsutum FP-91666 SS1]|uniref:uncharacterized protein n=1 Tax=Stereum hirsutum (strain FP-91666) TaxID=721885 RepID=UPI000440E40B|nr:uncharacterized protein STEHIDRAFT_120419 [Stereum hirsutum FP-91666 SS1]EIM88210.1 hypothetical protein STEHIDRAFT_120419 [Stereum hirsutum FP-91666 SS1]
MSRLQNRRKEDIDYAHQLQTRAGLMGAARYFALGVGVITASHYYFPTFRRQTLAIKGFAVTLFTVFGLVTYADDALLAFERRQRVTEGEIRRAAALDLARKGMVATETEIEKWRTRKEQEALVAAASTKEPSTPP